VIVGNKPSAEHTKYKSRHVKPYPLKEDKLKAELLKLKTSYWYPATAL